MKKSNQFIWRSLLLLVFATIVKTVVFAQQWVMDDIAEDDEGGLFSGIFGAILLLGFIWLLGTLFGGQKKDNSPKQSNHKDYVTEPTLDDKDGDEDTLFNVNDETDEIPIINSPASPIIEGPKETNVKTNISEAPQQIIDKPKPQQVDALDNKNFREKCIAIYGDYAENTYGLVLIKEDGEYRQISYPDKRYEVLSTYIYQYHKERHATVCTIGNGEQLKYYIEHEKKYKLFPEAKPMSSHGNLEKEYYGERIAMMMAYYDEFLKRYPIYSSNAHSLRDFCLSLGWDVSIYIHRYIMQPMDMQVYHDLKEMVLRKMTKGEYLEYRKKADYITDRGKDGYFDGWGNRIGSTYDEASMELRKRSVLSFDQAIKEVNEFSWKL